MPGGEIPAEMASFVGADELPQDRALFEQSFDLVVFVDVTDPGRVGPAKEALPQAKAFVGLDHHSVNPSREALKLPDDAPCHFWISDGINAASSMVAGLVRHLEISTASPLTDEVWRDIALPLAAGLYSDTVLRADARDDRQRDRPFKDGTDLVSAQMFSELLRDKVGMGFEAFLDLAEFSFPPHALVALQHGVEPATLATGTLPLTSIGCQAPVAKSTLLAAKQEDSRTSSTDVIFALCALLDQARDKSGGCALLWMEQAKGIKLSVRSSASGDAAALAKLFGGDGKLREAGAFVSWSALAEDEGFAAFVERKGAPLTLIHDDSPPGQRFGLAREYLEQRAIKWQAGQSMQRLAQLRVRGSA